jgi:hypothetical protein
VSAVLEAICAGRVGEDDAKGWGRCGRGMTSPCGRTPSMFNSSRDKSMRHGPRCRG